MTLFTLFSALSIALVAAQLASVQHAALMTFYDDVGCNATACPRFAANEPCIGTVLLCNGTDVVDLGIVNRGLNGTMSRAIGQLTALTRLSVALNALTGAIPSAVGLLTALLLLALGNNILTGTISNAVGQLTALTTMSVRNNARLSGAIPNTFGQLSNLVELNLGNTQLNGTFPPTTAPLSVTCLLDRTFLDCSFAPRSCTCNARLLGDDCENRRPNNDGPTRVFTTNATTCVGCGSCAIQNDLWWEWTASCTGTATISTCALAPTDTMLGIYRGVCPSASTPTATTESGSADCNDFGSCGGSGQEEATFSVVSGERIIIRLGTPSSLSAAAGTLSISCSGITMAPTTTSAAASTTVAVTAGPTTEALSTSVGATVSTTPASVGMAAAPTTTDTTASASTTAAAAVNASSAPASASTPTVVDTTANASTTAAPPANASISATAPAATPSSGADIALIAGAAGGGAAALLLLTGLILFFVCRARKSKAPNNERAPGGGNELRQSHYGSVTRASSNEYDVGDVANLPASNQYGRINAGAEPRYSDPGVLQAGGGGIQVKQTGVSTTYSAL